MIIVMSIGATEQETNNVRDQLRQYDLTPHDPLPPCPSSYGHFVDSIVRDEPHIATGDDGVTVMQLLDAIYASAAKGEPIRV